jgi:hypothetical protein
MLSPVQTEETLGEAEVRALFRVSRLGTIAGCMVTSGIVRRGAQVRIVRDGTVIHETSIAQLKRFKDDAREVAEGFECGILLDGFNDVKEGDVLGRSEPRSAHRPTVAGNGGARRAGGGRSEQAEPGPGYIGILSAELRFPDNHSLKGKRKELLSVKSQLARRFGASVAEVDHHDVWQAQCARLRRARAFELLDSRRRRAIPTDRRSGVALSARW